MDRYEKNALIGASAFVVALFIWWACHWVATAPSSGVVTSKSHTLPHTTMMYTGKVMIPQHHPESWSITYYNSEVDRSWSYNVSQSSYDSFKVGDTISFK